MTILDEHGNSCALPVTYDKQDILARLPHRFENVLIDQVTCDPDHIMAPFYFSTCLSDPDPENRHLFFEKNIDGTSSLISTLLPECMALAGLTAVTKKENHLGFFASINHFETSHSYDAGEALYGSIIPIKIKEKIVKFKGLLYTQKHAVASAEIMALIDNLSARNTHEPKPIDPVIQADHHGDRIVTTWNKDPHMVMMDKLVYLSPTTCLGCYTFPPTHPLTRGHFPSFNVMMGVLQWLMVSDTVYAACHHGWQPDPVIHCQATLYNHDHIPIATIQDCVVACHLNPDKTLHHTSIIQTKKVAFKYRVSPGDTLYAHVERA